MIDTKAILQRMQLDPKKPIVLYAGTYVIDYPEMFGQFVDYVDACKDMFNHVQLLIVPHPRYKGIIEKKMVKRLDAMGICYRIVGEYEEHHLLHIKTIEALCCSDVVITSNATATLVLQANSISKKVIYIDYHSDKMSTFLSQKKVVTPVTNPYQLAQELERIPFFQKDPVTFHAPDMFQLLGIPKHAAATLWNMFIT